MSLKEIAGQIYTNLEAQNALRDRLNEDVHKMLRETREAISAVHRGELIAAAASLTKAKALLKALHDKLSRAPSKSLGSFAQSAEGEVAEAALLLAFREGKRLPSPNKIGVGDMGYLLGLGDLVGELRRVAVDALKDDNSELAARAFDCMEETYSILLTFDFPRSLIPGIRQKTDVARGLVERTRADISTDIQRRRLLTGIAQLQKSLKSK
jgi:translin